MHECLFLRVPADPQGADGHANSAQCEDAFAREEADEVLLQRPPLECETGDTHTSGVADVVDDDARPLIDDVEVRLTRLERQLSETDR